MSSTSSDGWFAGKYWLGLVVETRSGHGEGVEQITSVINRALLMTTAAAPKTRHSSSARILLFSSAVFDV